MPVGRGLDTSQPPLYTLPKIFQHLVESAVVEGLGEALDHLDGRAVRIATMCSGTESPILAMEMIAEGTVGFSSPKHVFMQLPCDVASPYINVHFIPLHFCSSTARRNLCTVTKIQLLYI